MLKTSKNLQKREKLKKCAYDTVIQPILWHSSVINTLTNIVIGSVMPIDCYAFIKCQKSILSKEDSYKVSIKNPLSNLPSGFIKNALFASQSLFLTSDSLLKRAKHGS